MAEPIAEDTLQENGLDSANQSLLNPSQLRSVILLAVVAPIVIWLLDFAILSANAAGLGWWGSRSVYFFFVVQIGLLGWFVGRYVRDRVIRWAVYCWLLALISLVVAATKLGGPAGWPWGNQSEALGFAIASGEVGMVIVWSVLGNWPWYWRIPFLLVGVFVLWNYVNLLDPRFNAWATQSGFGPVLVWQAASAFVLCLLLRLNGFRVAIVKPVRNKTGGNSSDEDRDSIAESSPPQFSIIHLLVWTTAMAPLFALARFVDMNDLRMLGSIWQPLALGTCFAIVSLIAIWSGLGREGLIVRLIVSLVLTYLVGGGIALASRAHWLDSIPVNRWPLRNTGAYLGFWLTWTMLAACFLGGMLLIFRAGNCRLVKTTNRDSRVRQILSYIMPHRAPVRRGNA